MSNSKSVPLTKDEALILVNLVKANKIVTSKATNTTNNQLKDKAWLKITEKFNSSISSYPRDAKQLRLKWENLKKTARKRSANIRMNQNKTGGGKPVYIPPDETLDLVASILGGGVGDGMGEIILVDPLPTLTTPNGKFPFGSSSKRTVKYRKIDKLAASIILRNTAVAKYYSKKTELLGAAYEEQKLKLRRLELENEKLKIELENLKNSTSK